MTRIADLRKAVTVFNSQVTVPMRGTKGGTTWTQVQRVAIGIPAALASPLTSIEQKLKSRDPKDKDKIPTYLKVMHTQFNAIKMIPVDKYIAEHSVGGKKVRGMFSSAADKLAEEKRVILAGKLKEQYADLKEMVTLIKTPADL